MARMFRKFAAAIAAVLCITGMTAGVRVLASDIPTVTFTNRANNSPDLYITKTVQDADGNPYETEEDLEFGFVVKLDGAFASQEAYRVYDSTGAEVFRYRKTDGTIYESTDAENSAGDTRLTYTTDSNGGFTLKAGQTARFEWVGTGVSYEVYEEETEGWTQILPAGGASATGTITANGSTAEFVNLRINPSDELVVYKTLSFPEGYTALESPDFTFQILISNEPYSNEYYEIIDTATGLSAGTGKTDEDGKFTLKGGQQAVFQVEQDLDYQVKEVTDDALEAQGWRVTTSSSYEGSTSDGDPLVFNNAIASFAVSKKIQDGTEEDEDVVFTFLLSQANRTIWAGATYWLYNTDGTPVYDEDGNITIGVTDEDGQFYLKANQTAVFYGIPAGTVYSVSEVKESGYNQIIPNASIGYTDKVVTDNVEVLPFVNEPSPAGMLTVTKVLDITGGVVPNAEDVFTFILYESQEVEQEGEVTEPEYEYVPAADKVYSVTVGSSTYTYLTDENGKFTLLANQTAVFEGLSNGLYKVEECEDGLTIEYSLEAVERTDADGTVLWQTEEASETDGTADAGSNGGSSDVTVAEAKEDAEIGTLTSEGLTYIFTNAYKACGVDLYLMKKSGNGTALNDAEFMLYYDQALQNPVSAEPYVSGSYVSDVDQTRMSGMISIEDLQAGTYYLVETKAPDGYSLLSEAICIGIVRTAQGFEITINGEEYTEDTSTIVGELNITGEEGNEILYLTVYNHKLLPIPMSGSAGSYITLILGLALVLMAAWKALSMTRGKKQRSK